jgi:hypothetical protein
MAQHGTGGFDPNEGMLAVLLRAPHRRQGSILQARGERIRVVIRVGHVEQISSSWEPDIEAERPWAVDPRSGEQRFGVVEKYPQSNLIRIAGLIP